MKIIASDYDGTLRQHDTVSAEDAESIRRWQKAGNLFGIITGRGLSSLQPLLRSHGVSCDFLITNNGAAIFDAQTRLLYALEADGRFLAPLLSSIRDHGGKSAAITRLQQRQCVQLSKELEKNPEERWITPAEAAGISRFLQVDCVLPDETRAHRLANETNRLFSKNIAAFPNGICVDIVSQGAGKTNGIHHLIRLFSSTPDDVLVIGDNYNDLEMIRAFSGFAVSSGKPEVREAARAVYPRVGDLIADFC